MPEYGLCGKSLVHSYSEIIHKKLGNDKYELINLSREEFFDYMKRREFSAVNVTIPYKTDAYDLCDELSEDARLIGSVNTVVNKNGRLCGYNTDVFGFLYMLSSADITLCGKKVLVLGTGGTSLTAQAVCKLKNAAEVVVVSRTGEVNYQNISKHSDADIIINTTPVGMYPENGVSPVELSDFPRLSGVVDVIYNPSVTQLLYQASKLGIPCVGGLPMLVAQAVRADEIFFDRKREGAELVIRQITDACRLMTMNILLVGMPGCGKTTVGKILSELSERELIDTDDVIEKDENKKISDIIPAYGEKYFRDLETAALDKCTKLSGRIISVGGGAVLREENRRLMKQNSVCIYIRRELSMLSCDGRPLSRGEGAIERLYAERKSLYEEVCDFAVDINEAPENCARLIYEKYLKGNGTK